METQEQVTKKDFQTGVDFFEDYRKKRYYLAELTSTAESLLKQDVPLLREWQGDLSFMSQILFHKFEIVRNTITYKKMLTLLPKCKDLHRPALPRIAKKQLLSFEEYFLLMLVLLDDFQKPETERGFMPNVDLQYIIGLCRVDDRIFRARILKDGRKWFMYFSDIDLNENISAGGFMLLAVKNKAGNMLAFLF